MKILMLGWELPPNNSGGLGVACLQLSKALSENGADIDFILPYSSSEKYGFMNVISVQPEAVDSITRINAYDSYKYVLRDGREVYVGVNDQQQAYEVAVGQIVKQMEFDVIHAHDWLTFRAALRAKQHTGKPLIVHIHSIERDRAGGRYGSPLVREIEATTMLLADRVIAVSARVKKMIEEDYAIPSDKIKVVHNSIDQSLLEPLDEQNAYHYLEQLKKSGWNVVVSIGRLTIQKGLTHFLRAAAKVAKYNPKTIFLVVGDGEQKNELIELAAELGIADRVIFTGFARGKNWRDSYAIGDLFVMSSVSEPFGLTPLEAIAYGTPVLISKQSGISEVLANCLKVDFWDEDEMANQIVGLLKSKSFREELHANAWLEYERMSWNDAADKLMAIYKSHAERILV
jgi:glycosyltransferase involved in cell wall biosynthesis